MKALKYLEFTQDTMGHQKVTEKLSARRIKYQTTRLMQEAQDIHDNGCQGVLRERHYDGMWKRRVGTWLHYMEKTYQKWLHEVPHPRTTARTCPKGLATARGSTTQHSLLPTNNQTDVYH